MYKNLENKMEDILKNVDEYVPWLLLILLIQ